MWWKAQHLERPVLQSLFLILLISWVLHLLSPSNAFPWLIFSPLLYLSGPPLPSLWTTAQQEQEKDLKHQETTSTRVKSERRSHRTVQAVASATNCRLNTTRADRAGSLCQELVTVKRVAVVTHWTHLTCTAGLSNWPHAPNPWH